MNKAGIAEALNVRMRSWVDKYDIQVHDMVDLVWLSLVIPEDFTTETPSLIQYLLSESILVMFDSIEGSVSSEATKVSHEGVLTKEMGAFTSSFSKAKQNILNDRDDMVSEGIKAVLESEIYAHQNSSLTEAQIEEDTEFNGIIEISRA